MLLNKIKKLEEKEKIEKEDSSFNELSSFLFNSINEFHKIHLKTTSYSKHIALGECYDSLRNKTDELIEMYQGCYNQLINCSNNINIDYTNELDLIVIVIDKLKEYKEKEKDSAIINLIEEIIGFLYRIKYKLNFLN